MSLNSEKNEVKSGLKLNIGCGPGKVPENWINIDNSFSARLAKYPIIKKFLYRVKILPKRLYDLPWPSNITVLDVRKGLPYKDNIVKYIQASHFLEHLFKKDAEYFLKECYRVMRKGGVIRIIVPDLRAGVKNYINKMEYIEKDTGTTTSPADEFIEGLGLYDNIGKYDSFLIKFMRILQGNKNIHKWIYDYYSLSLRLKLCGFAKISRRKYLDSQIKDINLLDRTERFKGSICIEAIKG